PERLGIRRWSWLSRPTRRRGRSTPLPTASRATPHACGVGPSGPAPHAHGSLPAEVEPVEVHHLVPRRDEVTDELLLRVVAGVHLGERTQLRVRAEDQVDPARGPLHLAGGGVPTLERVPVLRRGRPR